MRTIPSSPAIISFGDDDPDRDTYLTSDTVNGVEYARQGDGGTLRWAVLACACVVQGVIKLQ